MTSTFGLTTVGTACPGGWEQPTCASSCTRNPGMNRHLWAYPLHHQGAEIDHYRPAADRNPTPLAVGQQDGLRVERDRRPGQTERGLDADAVSGAGADHDVIAPERLQHDRQTL